MDMKNLAMLENTKRSHNGVGCILEWWEAGNKTIKKQKGEIRNME